MSTPDLVPIASTELGAWVLELLKRSPMPIPKLRKDALRESFRVAQSDDELKDIFLDAVCGSPYVENHMKEQLASVVVGGDWTTLGKLAGLQTDLVPQYTASPQEILSEFKYLATRIFIKSRVLRKLSLERRKYLGKVMLECQSKEAVMELVLVSLEESQFLDHRTRIIIANDVFEGKFHNLLLKNRFDCDELPRLESCGDDKEPDECVICLDLLGSISPCFILSKCGHEFCKPCIEDVAQVHNGNSFPCPICRTENTLQNATNA